LKKLALLGATVGVAASILIVTRQGNAADHLDAPGVATNPMGDVNDVYTWMTGDGAKVNLAMTVSPGDDGSRAFGPTIQYAWHVSSHPGADNATAFFAAGTDVDVICTFASNTSAECWVKKGSTVLDYVKGDPSTAMTSADGKMKVFAGRRSDPFFFNLAAFKKTVGLVEGGGGSANAAGCPLIDAATANVLRTSLATPVVTGAAAPCPNNQADCFANFNVMAIVAQVDKTLFLQNTDHLLSVWGSTHAKP